MQPHIKYARSHGLIKDHLEVDPLRPPSGTLPLRESLLIEDEPDIRSIIGAHGKIPNERPQLGIEALMFLKSSIQPPIADESDSLRYAVVERRRNNRQIKVEPPMLRTDPEYDLRAFKQRIAPDLVNENLPFQPIDDVGGEGIISTSNDNQRLRELCRHVYADKPSISIEGLKYLKSCVEAPPPDECATESWLTDYVPRRRRESRNCPISPPLLPLSPEGSTLTPPLDAKHIEPRSDVADSIEEDISEADKIVFRSDRNLQKGADTDQGIDAVPGSDSAGDLYSPSKGTGHEPFSCTPEKLITPGLKVEMPLLPASPEKSLPWTRKHVSFAETLVHIIPNSPSCLDHSDKDIEDDIEEFFSKEVVPRAKEAELRIANEQLEANNASHRIRVPIMDFSRPRAPWDTSVQRSASESSNLHVPNVLEELKAIDIRKHLWRTSPKAERALTWVPFPASLGNIDSLDVIQDDQSVAKFIDAPPGIDSSTLMWKPDGLRILDKYRETEEEKLEEGHFPAENDIGSILRKRKVDLEDEIYGAGQGIFKHHRMGEHPTSPDLLGNICTTGSLLDESDGAASKYLGVFLSYRTGNPEHLKALRPATDPVASTSDQPIEDLSHQKQDSLQAATTARSLPIPTMNMPAEPRQFVVSTSFLLNRSLKNRITSLYPNALMIERDLGSPNFTTQRLGISESEEADIIVSPSAALLTTTLQKIKQRPLPGSERKTGSPLSPLQARIYRSAQHYERLLVLISQNVIKSDGAVPDSAPSDCEAIAEFTAYCTGLANGVDVLFVAGGEEQLAQWVVSLMIKHSSSDLHIKLTAEETPEEHVLRSAGLNSFAAQVVMGRLREKGIRGIGPFLVSTLEQKVGLFERQLGGRKCLNKLQEVVEARW